MILYIATDTLQTAHKVDDIDVVFIYIILFNIVLCVP